MKLAYTNLSLGFSIGNLGHGKCTFRVTKQTKKKKKRNMSFLNNQCFNRHCLAWESRLHSLHTPLRARDTSKILTCIFLPHLGLPIIWICLQNRSSVFKKITLVRSYAGSYQDCTFFPAFYQFAIYATNMQRVMYVTNAPMFISSAQEKKEKKL